MKCWPDEPSDLTDPNASMKGDRGKRRSVGPRPRVACGRLLESASNRLLQTKKVVHTIDQAAEQVQAPSAKLAGAFHPARLNRSTKDPVPYSKEALRQDLARVRLAWEQCQASRDRNAIYGYLSAVFDLVMWWAAEDRAVSRARWALQLCRADLLSADEPFAVIIFCTSDPAKVDKRTRSKWSRALRYAMEYKTNVEPLAAFVRKKGGINECATRFTRCLGRGDRAITGARPEGVGCSALTRPAGGHNRNGLPHGAAEATEAAATEATEATTAAPRRIAGTPTHGYEPTREAAMAAFAKSWRRE